MLHIHYLRSLDKTEKPGRCRDIKRHFAGAQVIRKEDRRLSGAQGWRRKVTALVPSVMVVSCNDICLEVLKRRRYAKRSKVSWPIADSRPVKR